MFSDGQRWLCFSAAPGLLSTCQGNRPELGGGAGGAADVWFSTSGEPLPLLGILVGVRQQLSPPAPASEGRPAHPHLKLKASPFPLLSASILPSAPQKNESISQKLLELQPSGLRTS